MSEQPSVPDQQPGQIVIVGPDGQPVARVDEPGEPSVADLIEQPAKVMRVGSMIKQLLEEVRTAPLDEASRVRLRDIHARSIKELESGLAPELIEELDRLSLPFSGEQTPSDAELRIAQAQLVGWLEGLFHGIQTSRGDHRRARDAADALRRPPPWLERSLPVALSTAESNPARAPPSARFRPGSRPPRAVSSTSGPASRSRTRIDS